MYFLNIILILALLLGGCKGTLDDLQPSGNDQRAEEVQTTNNQTPVYDFSILDQNGQSRNLAQELGAGRPLVLYFTMWCPICNAHTDHLLTQTIPKYSGPKYFLVDYISGSASAALRSRQENGYESAAFELLVDQNNQAINAFSATMGTTVVLSANGELLFNEDLKDGVKLEAVLAKL